MLLAWHKYGGGKELLAKLYSFDRRQRCVVPVRADATRSRSAGSRSRSPRLEDFQGVKYRTVGISIDVFTGMGAPSTRCLAAKSSRPWTAACSTRRSSTTPRPTALLGFADVSKICMLQSYHQNAEQFEIMFNKTKYDALPEKMRAIIANGVEAASART